MVPSRLIVTSSGAVHLAADTPIVGGLDGIWTHHASGNSVTFRQVLDSIAIHSTSRLVHADMIWQCGGYTTSTYTQIGGSGTLVVSFVPVFCDSPGAGGTPPADPSGGGTPAADTAEVSALQQQYAGCPPVPAASDFIVEAQYINPGHFSFAELKDSRYDHAILSAKLVNGLESTRSNYGDTIQVNAGYRAPLTNGNTTGAVDCSNHVRGFAADINIRNLSGAHDCAKWDEIAAAGSAAGAWVESWAETVRRSPNGGDHVHLDFGRPPNRIFYGTCIPSELAP